MNTIFSDMMDKYNAMFTRSESSTSEVDINQVEAEDTPQTI